MAMILAAAALLSQTDGGRLAGRAIRESALEAVAEGIKTADLGGHSSTTEYTDEVIRRTRTKLEVWAAL
jgi:isocitrate/isopropylmalate dehydrogenase